MESRINIGDLHQAAGGLTEAESQSRIFLFGRNEIVVPLDSILVLMVKEILTPFYVFQVFSITFWYVDEYWKYSSAILLTSLLSLSTALYQTRKNQHNLRDTIVSSEAVRRLRPDGSSEQIISSELVVMAVHRCSLAISPRRMFMTTVSAMSSALCPVTILVTPSCMAPLSSA